MPVYIDNAAIGFGRMTMYHLIADTPDELHAMVDTIGVSRRHFQDPRTMKVSAPHYDISKGKRRLAIEAGAIECDRSAFVGHLRRIRASEAFR